MATVQIEYYGMTGTGKNLKEAKADAGRKIEAAVTNWMEPRVITCRGEAMLIFATKDGVGVAFLTEGGKVIDRKYGLCYSTEPDWDTAEQRARLRLAQYVWTPADGENVPDCVKDKDDRREVQEWARWQMRYQAHLAKGCTPDEAHRLAFDGAPVA